MNYTDEYIHEQLKFYFGFDNFKGLQLDVIKNILAKKDTFVIMPTGGGKSMCFQLPALMQEGTSIIISPLIALMKNQVDSIRSFGTEDGVAHFLNSSLNKSEISKVRNDVVSGRTKMLYVAPESLTKEENISFLKGVKISFYAVDEAHCISEWGHDFRPEYRKIRTIVEQIGKAPIIALTATATPKVQEDIIKNLDMVSSDIFKSSFNRENLFYDVRPKINAQKELVRFIRENEGKSGIVYCLSRKRVEELAETLNLNGIKARAYHAGMDTSTRSANQDAFLMEDVDVIVATIAFGMGIDKPDVRFVIHYDIPKSLEGYYQETGRAGRDGGEGYCLSFYDFKDVEKMEKLLKGKPISEQEVSKHLLMEVASYAETSICRRKTLLHYFGETYKEDDCGACSNCLNPKPTFNGEHDLLNVLICVKELKEQFRGPHIISILLGELTSEIKTFHHDKLSSFAKSKDDEDKDDKFWAAVIRQALINDFLVKDIENYGVLKLSVKGRNFIENPHDILLSRDHDYDKMNSELSEDQNHNLNKSGAADSKLFEMLKDLRKSISKKLNLPPFVIFQDTSLEDMCIQYPISLEELNHIQGVGSGKATKYGHEFIELIKNYVQENEIERPIDLIVKSVVNKSGLKVYIIQNIDRKVDLDDIARSKGLGLADLLTEMEAIVSSGTKLDITYYINEVLDDDPQEDIYLYFKEAETDSLEDAIAELGDEYSEEEIRLVRLKFISELGN